MRGVTPQKQESIRFLLDGLKTEGVPVSVFSRSTNSTSAINAYFNGVGKTLEVDVLDKRQTERGLPVDSTEVKFGDDGRRFEHVHLHQALPSFPARTMLSRVKGIPSPNTYYNGSCLKPLSVDISQEPPPDTEEIQALVERLSCRPDLFKTFRPVDHGVQLTFECGDLVDPEAFRREFVLSGFGLPAPLKILCLRA